MNTLCLYTDVNQLPANLRIFHSYVARVLLHRFVDPFKPTCWEFIFYNGASIKASEREIEDVATIKGKFKRRMRRGSPSFTKAEWLSYLKFLQFCEIVQVIEEGRK